jgi:hypothetical protein
MPAKVTGVEVFYLEKPLKERFWMANAPIGGYQPKASRLIVRLHTDAGIIGEGEGSGGPDLFRKGFVRWYDDFDPFRQVKLNTRILLASGESEISAGRRQ